MTLSDLENLDGKKCAHTCNSPESVLKIVDVFIETRRRELWVQTWASTGKGKGGHLTHLGRLEVHQEMHTKTRVQQHTTFKKNFRLRRAVVQATV